MNAPVNERRYKRRRRISEDIDRPRCPNCGLPMGRNGHGRSGQQKWACWTCRGLLRKEDGPEDVAVPLPFHLNPSAVRCPVGGCGRKDTPSQCIYWPECEENARHGMPLLGERTATVWVGGRLVTV